MKILEFICSLFGVSIVLMYAVTIYNIWGWCPEFFILLSIYLVICALFIVSFMIYLDLKWQEEEDNNEQSIQ